MLPWAIIKYVLFAGAICLDRLNSAVAVILFLHYYLSVFLQLLCHFQSSPVIISCLFVFVVCCFFFLLRSFLQMENKVSLLTVVEMQLFILTYTRGDCLLLINSRELILIVFPNRNSMTVETQMRHYY